jgi:hypothetical protein
MNKRPILTRITWPLLCGLALIMLAAPARAQLTTNLFEYQGNQGGSPGSNWNGSGITSYWTNINPYSATGHAPTNGTTNANATNYNFYVLTNNGLLYGNGVAVTLIRNPYTAGGSTTNNASNTITFPGDSLILLTNTSIRFKNLGGTGTFVTGCNYATPTNQFPGHYGQPGLVLNGGVLNNGTTGTAFVIQGTMYAVPGSQSYINSADTLNSDVVTRGLIFQAQLTGGGAIALLNCASVASGAGNTALTPTPFTATNNNFTGKWIVKSGWLQGVGDGTADGYNTLGTNNSTVYDIDPMWTPPAALFNANSTFFNGPAVLDFGAGLVNSGGSLILSNGGKLYLHGNLIFTSVNLEGTMLANGTYTYAQLVAMVAGANQNFSPGGFPPGSGTLTVQPPGTPVIPGLVTLQPQPEVLYSNVTATFTAQGSGLPAPSFYWQSNGVNLANGGSISGASSPTLTISGVNGSDAASYAVVVSNAIGASTSSVATLQVVGAVEPYEEAVTNLNPFAFYQFNDVNNPTTGIAECFDYAGGFNGVYGTAVQNGFYGTPGPTASSGPPGFPGFNSTNLAASFSAAAGNNVELPPWNYSGNTMTFTAWLNPAGVENPAAGVVICRGTGVVAGLVYYGSAAVNGSVPIGYVWNNDPATYGWNSGLVPAAGQWNLVALVISPASATVYVMNANGLESSTQVYPNPIQTFNTNEYIGEDAAEEGGNGTRSFFGVIDDVAMFNTALTRDQVAGLFYAATGVTNYAPIIDVQPLSQTAYVGQTVQFYVGADGSEPLTYQWAAGVTGSGGPYNNLTDGVNGVTGSQTATLTIANVNASDALDYVVIVSNSVLAVESSPATLTVDATSPAIFNITMSQQEPAGDDWNTVPNWSDGNPASVSAVSEPGSTYEILQGARLRTPTTPINAVFPGDKLLLDGTGVFVNNPAAGTTQGELRCKQPEPASGSATITFPLLVMAGGQLDLGNAGTVTFLGTLDVVSNSIIYVDNAGSDGRIYQMSAYLTGSGNLMYQDFDATLSGGLFLNCPTNSYTGAWTVPIGPLVGVGSNSLGTNTITIGAAGVLQTYYNINNSNANLIMTAGGRVYLTQNDTFATVILGSTALTNGIYPAAVLCSNYPAYFPSNWVALQGPAGPTNATGSITVLANSGATIVQNPLPTPVTIYPSQSVEFSALGGGNAPLYYQWRLNGVKLTDSTNVVGGLNFMINGSQTPNLSLSNIPASYAGSYTIVVSNSISSVTSAPAILTILPTFPAENIQMSYFETTALPVANPDWNSAGVWNDGQGGLPASTSALEFPGSTYELLPGALLRTPVAAIPYTNFPGIQLTVDGAGVFNDNGANATGTAQAEIRFKEGISGEINYFPLLIMAGGQLDNGNAGLVAEIAGNMDIISNAPIYADDAGSTPDRPWQIDACISGNGSVEYHDSDATLSGGLYITCNTNTFTGTWNIVTGPLVGGGTNCLGTNNITIGAQGVLETLYNINSPQARLNLQGQMYLHQNDTFNQVQVGSAGLLAGTYTYAQLAAAFPASFPLAWGPVFGSTSNSASGSITVLTSLVLPPFISDAPPTNTEEFVGAKVTYSVEAGGNAGSYQWYVNGVLISGATGSSYTFISALGANNYTVVVSNAAGMATNLGATNVATDLPVEVTFSDTQNWTLQGAAVTPFLTGGVLQLTDNGGGEAASAFYDIAQYIEGFDTSFTYTPSGSLAADGVTFCVQNAAAGPAALGASGGDLAYFGITNSAAFELNIYALATGGVGIGTGTNGQIALPYGAVSNSSQSTPLNLASGDPININLYYGQGVLQATLVDSVTSVAYVTNFHIGDIGPVIGGSVAYIGFTGSDGGSESVQQISNFSFLPAAPALLSISNSGGGSITISWSAGVLPGFVLQQSPSLTGPWSNVSATPTVVGSQYQVVLTPGGSPQYYRLELP